jgi:hypothetical protein
MLPIFSVAPPVLLSVSVCVALLALSPLELNLSALLDRLATGTAPEPPKFAVTDAAAFMVTEQVPVPEHAPLHPVKLDPEAGVSVRVTMVPVLKFAVQVPGQLIPAGVLVRVPVPVPASVTVNGCAELGQLVTKTLASTDPKPVTWS